MRSRRTNSGPSQRQLRVGEQIRHLIAETLQRGHFHDESLLDTSQISVSEVRAAPDLRNATAYVVGLGDTNIEDIIPALNNATHIFQKDINAHSNLKFTPRIHFTTDKSFERSKRIDELLGDITYAADYDESSKGEQ